MSPESDAVDAAYNKVGSVFTQKMEENEGKLTNNTGAALMHTETETVTQTETVQPLSQMEAPNKPRSPSPTTIGLVLNTFVDPMSPSSSSSTSHTNSGDVTFEPTIDMMVNDFDDEQTLNEEEALAALESQDPQDEISTLKEEGEMPLEELLAKYNQFPPSTNCLVKKSKASRNSGKRNKFKEQENGKVVSNSVEEKGSTETSDIILVESSDEGVTGTDLKATDEEDETTNGEAKDGADVIDENDLDYIENCVFTKEKGSSQRSHLLDLYSEDLFTGAEGEGEEEDKDVTLEMQYGEEGEDDEDDEDDDDDPDNDYVKKTIMVGAAYQAVIPVGLSQYGDVLPYENEDKLIWEPSQVSEREVEEYLQKVRDIKPTLPDDESINTLPIDENLEELTCVDKDSINNAEENSMASNENATTISGNDIETGGVVKDNEQALHLLVQCGYDFKEALRRKRLNALPHTGAMSLWSEEECQKFEEGIQKFGKDFLKIRQNQVRTRSMRELVQFYYLWKKSERRDHNFANSDTVDHMDIYLNEGGDYGSSTPVANKALGGPTVTPPALSTRKNAATIQKNFLVMSGCNNVNSVTNSQLTTTAGKISNNNRRRSSTNEASSLPVTNINDNQILTASTSCLK